MNIGDDKLANRPVFTIAYSAPFCIEINTEFTFYSGFSASQKKKSIRSLQEAFLKVYPNNKVLEISSNSENSLGVQLSAFNLTLKTKSNNRYSVEVAFQSSKVFQNGGPYKDILEMTPKEAKKDTRLKFSGGLVCFNFFGRIFTLNPVTYFYNWLYVNTLNTHPDLANELLIYDAFTDIAFNPEKSINCQARAAAVYVSLVRTGLLDQALKSKENFLSIVYGPKEQPLQPLGSDLHN
jgi:type I restriction enzyme M protein